MIDHVVYGAPDLDDGVTALERLLGVRASFGGKHTGRGTHNALLALGESSYLEVIAPDPAQQHQGPLSFGVHPGMQARPVGWAAHTREIEARVARSRAAGHDPGDVQHMQRQTPDGTILRWRLTRSSDEPGNFLVPFLIDWGETPHPSQTAPPGVRLVRLRAEHPDPDSITAQLQAMEADISIDQAPAPALIAVLETPRGRVELR